MASQDPDSCLMEPPPQDEVEPVKLLVPLKDVKVDDLGQEAIFDCGISELNIHSAWCKGEQQIQDGENHIFSTEGKLHVLHIPKVSLDDEAQYTVSFTGTDITSSANLTIQADPAKLLVPLNNVTVDLVGQRATFECVLSKPDVCSEWYKDGKKIKASGRYVTATTGRCHTLTIPQTTDDDESQYTIKFKHTDIGSSAKLMINDANLERKMLCHSIEALKKELTDERPRLVGPAGLGALASSVHFLAELISFKILFEDDTDNIEVEKTRADKASALIKYLLPCNNSKVVLFMWLLIKKDSSHQLQSITDDLKTLLAQYSKRGIKRLVEGLDQKHKGPPSPPKSVVAANISGTKVELKWQKPDNDGGCPITGYIVEKSVGTTQQYTKVTPVKELQHQVDNLQPGTSYMFRVTAQNGFGTSDYVYLQQLVETKSPPSPPENVVAPNITDTKVTLQWQTPDDDGGCPITGYIVEKSVGTTQQYTKVTSVRELQHQVDNLQPETSYMFRVTAQNKVGTSDYVYLQQPVRTKSYSKTTYQRSAKGPVSIMECSDDGKYVVIQNTGRREESLSGWRIQRIIDGSDRADFTMDFNIKRGQKIKIFAKGSRGYSAGPNDIECSYSSWGIGDNIITKLINPKNEARATHIKKTIHPFEVSHNTVRP